MKNENIIFLGVVGILIVILITVVLLNKNAEKPLVEDLKGINYEVEGNTASLTQYNTKNPVVAFYVRNYGSIVMELYPNYAPNTVNNFISLVKSGYYDHNTIHRIDPGFVVQGGDPTGTGSGGPGYSIKGEFKNNGFQNDLKHTKGVVSMARGSYSMDSAGGQFFIMLSDRSDLDGNYAAFGRVIDGMELVEAMEDNEVVADEQSGKLQTNLVIVKALVDTKSINYPEVEKIK